jgi:hypothetical protein
MVVPAVQGPDRDSEHCRSGVPVDLILQRLSVSVAVAKNSASLVLINESNDGATLDIIGSDVAVLALCRITGIGNLF